jgi:Zn-dependent membrane protease YugP
MILAGGGWLALRVAKGRGSGQDWFMLFVPLLLLAIGLGVCSWASRRFEAAWAEGSALRVPTAHTAAEVARLFLNFIGESEVEIRQRSGLSSNFYDPARRCLFLEAEVAESTHMAGWALALHEAGHAAAKDPESLAQGKWRRWVIRLNRLGPTLIAVLALMALVLLRMPGRLAMMGWLLGCVALMLLHVGTLGLEFAANRALEPFLEKHLQRYPRALEKLQQHLSACATRELADPMRSPRFFISRA